jgi:uncharacterized protein (TIGR02466 family)
MEQITIFSIPIWEADFFEFENYKDKFLNSVKEYRKENPEGCNESNLNGYQSPKFLHSKEDLRYLFEYICGVANKASNELNFVKNSIYITSSWVNFNENRECMNSPHTHGDVFSGVFYLQVPRGSGKLCFINPAINSMWKGKELVEEKSKFTSEILKIEPQEGQLIIWPSYVQHYVEPNIHDDARISISFQIVNILD